MALRLVQVNLSVWSTTTGDPVNQGTVDIVRVSTGETAIVYDDDNRTNPHSDITISRGRAVFWVDPGTYQLTISGPLITTYTEFIDAFNADDFLDISAAVDSFTADTTSTRADLDTHIAATQDVHGIADTSLLMLISTPLTGDLGGTFADPTVLSAQTGFTVGGLDVILSSDPRLTDARSPVGIAGGDLEGSYPNPQVARAQPGFTVGNIAVVLDDDIRLINSRVPTGAASGDLGGTYPNPTVVSAQTGFTIGGVAAVVTTDTRLTDARSPSGAAGGVLGGTYPNPSFATPMASQASLDAHTTATANVHGITNTANLVYTTDTRLTDTRVPKGAAGGDLGGTYPNPTVTKAQAGFTVGGTAIVLTTDARLTDARAPTGAAGGVLAGGYPNPTFAVDMVTQAELDAHTSVTTNVHGITNTANLVYTTDARLSDARTPLAHTHPISDVTGLQTALDATEKTVNKGQAGGYASLDAGGLVPITQLPAGVLTTVTGVASQAAQLAVIAQTGDVVVRSDINKSYMRNTGTAGTMADWTELLARDDLAILEGDARLSDARVPTGAAGGVLSGTYPNPGFSVDMATQAELDAGDASTLAASVILTPTASTRNVIQPSAASVTPLITKGAASQTANLQEWQNSAGTALVKIDSAGILTVTSEIGTKQLRITNGVTSYITASSYPYIYSTNGGGTYPFDATGHLIIQPRNTTAAYDIIFAPGVTPFPALVIKPTGQVIAGGAQSAAVVPLVAKGASGQTGDIQQWQDSAGTVLGGISPAGRLTLSGVSGFYYRGGVSGNIAFAAGSATIVPFYISDSGLLAWGDTAGASYDVNLSRSATGTLLLKGLGLATGTTLAIQAITAQSSNLQEWRDPTNAILASMSAGGKISVSAIRIGTVATAGQFLTTDVAGNASWATLPVTDLAAAAILAPAASSRNTIVPTAVGVVPITLKGMAGQTGDLTQWQSSSGAVLASVSSAGKVFATTLKVGTAAIAGQVLTADASGNATWQTVASSGDVSSAVILAPTTSTRNIVVPTTNATALVLRGVATQSVNIQEWQNSAGAALASISSAGKVYGSALQVGTATTTGYVLTADAAGNASWQPIPQASTPDLSPTVVIAPGTDARNVIQPIGNFLGLTIKGNAAQVTDLQQWQDSTGAVLSSITAAGALKLSTDTTISRDAARRVRVDASLFTIAQQPTDVVATVRGAPAQTANLQEWLGGGGTALAWVNSTGILTSSGFATTDIGSAFGSVAALANVTLTLSPDDTGTTPLAIQGLAGQTADLQQWQNTAGTVLSRIKGSGQIQISDVGTTVATTSTPLAFKTGVTYALHIQKGYTANHDAAILHNAYFEPGGALNWVTSHGSFGSRGITFGLSTGIRFLADSAATTGDGTATSTTRMTINNDGTVGIGTTAPAGQLHVAGGDPASPQLVVSGVTGQTGDLVQWRATATGAVLAKIDAGGTISIGGVNVALVNDARFTDSRTPSGAAGGVLAGTYPNPSFASDMATQAELDAAILTVASLSPATSTRNVITAGGIGVLPLAVKAVAGQTANLFEVQDSTGALVAGFGSNGTVYASTFRQPGGTNDKLVIGSASPSIRVLAPSATWVGLEVKAAATQTADIQQWTNSTGIVLARVTSGGTFQVGSTSVVLTNDARLSDARAPSGAAGGDLGGTYPNPTVTKAQTGFTVGGTAVVLTTDARLSDGRTPSGAAGGDLAGTYPNPTIKASVGLTGVPTAPTAAVDTNTTQIATTAFVLAQAGSAVPAALGVAAVGTSTRYARQDHVHATPTNMGTTDTAQTFTAGKTWQQTDFANSIILQSTTASSTRSTNLQFKDNQATPQVYTVRKDGDQILFLDSAGNQVAALGAGATTVLTGTGYVNARTGFRINGVALASTHLSDGASLAPLASPAFTGTPTAPTAAADTNTTQIATTAFVLGQAGVSAPSVAGAAAAGTSLRYSREDHVHPTDTSRAGLASPAFTGTPTAPTAVIDTNTTQIATTAFVLAQAGSAVPTMAGVAAAGTSLRYARQDHVHPTDTSRAALVAQTLTGTQTIVASGVNNVPLIVKGFAGQSTDLQQWQDSTGATIASVGAAGLIHVAIGDSAASPGFSWQGDANTGMFRAAADTLAWTTAGVEAMRLDTSNRLLINTTTQNSNQLTIATASGQGGIRIDNLGASPIGIQSRRSLDLATTSSASKDFYALHEAIANTATTSVVWAAQLQNNSPSVYLFPAGAYGSDITAAMNEFGGTAISVLSSTADYIYFGRTTTFTRLYVDRTTGAVGASLVWEYWNGAGWSPLTVTDTTNDFNAATGWVSWTAPGDWATSVINPPTSTAQFYVRAHSSAAATTWPTITSISNGTFAGYLAQFLVGPNEKFRIGNTGDLYAGKRIFPGANVDGSVIQTSRYIADDPTNVGLTTNTKWITTVAGGGKNEVQITSTTANTGITIGGDTNIYRSAANTLATDDDLRANLKLGVGGAVNAGAQATITNLTAVNIGVLVKGAASQTGSLQEWQDSTGTVLAKIGSGGGINVLGTTTTSALRGASVTGQALTVYSAAAGDKSLVLKGAAAQTANLFEVQDSAGGQLAHVTPAGTMWSSTLASANGMQIARASAPAGPIDGQVYYDSVLKVLRFYNQGVSRWFSLGDTNMVNVKDFGAKGDNSTNDYAAIQAAITYIQGLTQGGVVFFPPGIYICNTQLNILPTKFLHLMGVGSLINNGLGSVIKRTGTNLLIDTSQTVWDTQIFLHISNLGFDGFSVQAPLLRLNCLVECMINNIKVGSVSDIGIELSQVFNCHIDGLHVHWCGYKPNGKPAVLIGYVANNPNGYTATDALNITNMEVDFAKGTSIKIHGDTATGTPVSSVRISNLKIETNNTIYVQDASYAPFNWPIIDIDYAQETQWSNCSIVDTLPVHTGALIRLGASGQNVGAPHSFDNFKLAGGEAASSNNLQWYIQIVANGGVFNNIVFRESPTVAYIRFETGARGDTKIGTYVRATSGTVPPLISDANPAARPYVQAVFGAAANY